MMSQPSRGVHLPTDGLTGWGEAARRTGEGISAVLSGGAAMLREQAQVTTTGELADFTERLRRIEQETREELASQDVKDWDYAWQKASAPKLAEAIDELSWDARGAGRNMAEVYNARASLMARRDHELQKIDKARSQWNSRVEEAVQAGDAERAAGWLEAGQGVFVTEGQLPARQEAVRSQANLRRWQRDLQEQPLRTLSRLAAAAQDELPHGGKEEERLAHARSLANRAARGEVLGQLVRCMEEELTPEKDFLDMAEKAGVLTAEQRLAAEQSEPPSPTAETRRRWNRRIDECPDDAEKTEALQLEIATAALPRAERRRLLERVQLSRSLPQRERQSLSCGLWELYTAGALGCPGDEEAQSHFEALQQQSLHRLAQGGGQEATRWVQGMRDLADRWVCFDPQSSVI